MITFFILFLLYCLILPFISYGIIKKKIKRIGRLRVIVNTRGATHEIFKVAMSWMGMNEKLIFEILKSNIDKKILKWNYFQCYNKNLIDELRGELNKESFNQAYQLNKPQ